MSERPFVVSLVQALLIVLGLFTTLTMVLGVLMLVGLGALAAWPVTVLPLSLLILLDTIAYVGLIRRRSWGRAVACLALFCATGPLVYFFAVSAFDFGWGDLFRTLLFLWPVPAAISAWLLFGRTAKEYFRHPRLT